MRNLLIGGEIVAVVLFMLWQREVFNITALMALWIIMGIWNILTYLKIRGNASFHRNETVIQLSFDIAAFTIFLYLTGGATNPLGWYYLVPIMISATLLPKKHTLVIAMVCILFYLLLLKYYLPLPGFEADEHAHHTMGSATEMDSAFSLHILGMWIGFSISALLVAWFVVDLASALRERDRHLSKAREEAMKSQQLLAMATLATGAAHELGTPLGTMMLVSEDLEEDYPEQDYPELYASTQTLKTQIIRCKEALSLITTTAGESHLTGGSIHPAGKYLDQIISDWQSQRKITRLKYDSQTDRLTGQLLADLTVTQAITNILNNAADASSEFIEIKVDQEPAFVVISVLDNGSGFPDGFCYKLGEELISSKAHGLGIGLLLTHATIHRLGGEIKCFNDEESGLTCTQVRLPLIADTREEINDN